MASAPLRPADETIANVGTRTGPAVGTPYGGDHFLAGTTYVADCNGNTRTNPPKPGFVYDPPEAAQGVVVESDGTIKQYIANPSKGTIGDYYCRNQGIAESKYQNLSDENKKNFCDEPINGTHYLTSPDCGSYVRQFDDPILVKIWYPLPDPPPQPDCQPAGKSLGDVSVVGSDAGTVFGTGPYSIGSDVGTAAVHAGLINVGDIAVIKKKSASPDKITNFPGGTANGVTTTAGSATVTGVISQIAVDVAGPLCSGSADVRPLNVNGDGAEIGVQTNGSFVITGTNIFGGGSGYKVGDTFQVTSLSFGGSCVDGLLRVTQVKSVQGGAQCGMNLEVVSVTTPGPSGPKCNREDSLVESTLYIGNPVNRGGVSEFELINPYPLKEYVFTNPSNGVDPLQTNTATTPQSNWYKSCPKSDYRTIDPDTGEVCDDIPKTNYFWYQTGGPSQGESNKEGFTLSSLQNFYNNQTDRTGCVGGTNCRSSTQEEVYDQRYINWYVRDLGGSGVGKGNPFDGQGGTGYAIGDEFELRPMDANVPFFDDNVPARIRVTAIKDTVDISTSILTYKAEYDVGLYYPDDPYLQNDLTDLFVSVTKPSDDPIANESVDKTVSLFEDKLGRPPKSLELQIWSRKIYNDGGNPSSATIAEFNTEFEAFIGKNVEILYCATGKYTAPDPGPQPGPSPAPMDNTPGSGPQNTGDCECIHDRNTFYVGTNGTSNGEVSLNEVWNFLGSPRNNPNKISPRPEDDQGLAQDNEPDLSDFFGMSLQRWVRCNPGDDMGCVEEIIVPVPGPCEESTTTEDGIAVWNDDWRISWNDGSSNTGKFLKEPLNSTIEALNNQYVSILGRPAERIGLMGNPVTGWEGWYNQALRIGLDDTLANIKTAAAPELARGGVAELANKCSYSQSAQMNLSFFLETRVAPWWGEQELEPPTLTMQKQSEFIYMVNVPPTQDTKYFFKVSPTLDANGKRFFEVNADVGFPALTGASRPGQPAIEPGNNVTVTWYKRSANNPDLIVMCSGTSVNDGGITENYGSKLTVTGTPWSNKSSGQLFTTFTDSDAKDGETVNPESLDFAQSGVEFFCKIEIDNRPTNPKTGNGYLPGFGGLANNVSNYLSNPSKFILNNIDCQDATITCSGNKSIEVKTNEPTSITFSMNISTNCLQYRSGTATISIKRYWPCPIFGPANPAANQWIVQKQSVAIPETNASSAQISYTLQVPTDKKDYLTGEDGNSGAPGDCHWQYIAYWEIDYPGVDCNANAWENPGCNTGEGKSQLDQIYCIQDQNCGGSSGPSGVGSCTNNTGIPNSQFDFDACLPLCSSASTIYFYWYYTSPQPGINCSGPVDGTDNGSDDETSGLSPYGPGCECPICEQLITVKVLEGTKCGILGPPNQQEGSDLGPNNGAMDFVSAKEGTIIINDYTSNPTVLPKDVLSPCDPEFVPGASASDDCLVAGYDVWVFLVRKTFDTLTTLGNDAAIRIIDYDTGEVDCDERVFTQVEFFREITFKNGTTSGLQTQGVWLGGAEWNATLAKYNPGAGVNTDLMSYKGEEGISSKKGTFGFIDTVWDKETYKGIKYFVRITSSNDYLGNVLYHPPPDGYIERDFDTVDTIVSLRGSQGAGPNNPGIKGPIFPIVNVTVADKQDVPEFTGSSSITCPTDEVPYQDLDKLNLENCCCAGTSCFSYYKLCGNFDTSICPAEPLEEVIFCATNSDGNQFSINWKDIPPSERKQLNILWYFDGALLQVDNLSQGERCSPDLRSRYGLLNKPETTHTISYYIVASSDGSAAWRDIDYDDTGNDGYFDVSSWKISTAYNVARNKTPIEQSEDRLSGERWQTVMAFNSCTFRVGPEREGLTIENPIGSIGITDITNPDGTQPGPAPGPSPGPSPSNCYYERCCDSTLSPFYTASCKARQAEIAAEGGICCGGQSPTGPTGPLGPFSPNIGPIRPF